MPNQLYTLEVTLTRGHMLPDFRRQNPLVSRTIQISGEQTLEQLHDAIFRALHRFDNSHLYHFSIGHQAGKRSPEKYVLPFILDDPERNVRRRGLGIHRR